MIRVCGLLIILSASLERRLRNAWELAREPVEEAREGGEAGGASGENARLRDTGLRELTGGE